MSYFTGVSRGILIRRLRWPALILLTGVMALLDEFRVVRWGESWPLYLIVLGLLALAENIAWSEEAAIQAANQVRMAQAGPGNPVQPAGTAIVPAPPQEGN